MRVKFHPAGHLIAGVALLCGACTGAISPDKNEGDRGGPAHAGSRGSASGGRGGGTSMAGTQGGTSGDPNNPPAACSVTPGPAPLRMLNPTEYDNTVRDLLGDATGPASTWPAPAAASGFDNDASGQNTDANQADLYRATATKLAAAAVSTRLSQLASCDLATAACVTTFIDGFGSRAYRRPLIAEDRDRFQRAFALGKQDGGVNMGARAVIELALQSPHFLYRVETASTRAMGDGAVALTDHEVASRLSYFLWNSMPDEALFAAARAGDLAQADKLRGQIDRMLADPKAKASIDNFHRQWLYFDLFRGAQKDTKSFPSYGPEMNASMVAGSKELLADVVLTSPRGDLEELLTASHAYANVDTAQLLGLSGSAAPKSKSFARVELDPKQRAGVLTDLTLMASLAKPNQTAPVLRGVFVREHMLCQTIPPPPPDVDNSPPVPDPTKTTRQQLAEHRASPSCAACHNLMDPVGFGFEGYDALGRHRTAENGLPVDSSGELTETAEVNGPFNGAVELARKLAAAEEVSACVGKQWFRYAVGRTDTEGESCALADVRARAGGRNFKLRDLLVAIATSPAFLGRPAIAVNGGCN